MRYFNSHFFNLSDDVFFTIDQNNCLREVSKDLSPFVPGAPLDSFLLEDSSQKASPWRHCLDQCRLDQTSFTLVLKIKPHSLSYECSFWFDKLDSVIVCQAKMIKSPTETSLFCKDFLNEIPMMIGFVNSGLEYTYVNSHFQNWLADDHIVGKKIGTSKDAKFHAMLAPYIDEVMLGKEQDIELILPPENQRPYQIVAIKMIPQKNGFCLLIQDITQLKNNASTAIEKEKKLSALLNSLPLGVVLHDSKGKIMEFNSSALRILGVSQEQLLGKSSHDPHWKVVDEELKDFPPNAHPAVITLETGLPVQNKIMGVYTSKDKISWINVTSIPIFQGQDLKPYQVIVTFEDRTKKILMAQELKTKSHWTEAILNGTSYCMISTLPNGVIKTFNKKAEQLLGYKASDLIDQKTVEIFHDNEELIQKSKELSIELKREISPTFEVFIAKAISSGSDTNTWTYVTKNGKKIKVRLCVTAILDEKKKCIGYLGIAEEEGVLLS